MKHGAQVTGAVTAVAIALLVSLHAEAALNPALQPCRLAVAKYSGKFVAKRMKALQKCREIDFRSVGACTPASIAPTIAALEQKLRDGIASRCESLSTVLLGAGFLDYPGKCTDTNAADGFTLSDLQNCMVSSHGDAVDTLIDIEYRSAPTDGVIQRCQKGIGKNAAKFVSAKLKAVQRCRTSVDRGKLTIAGSTCATADAKTAALIAKAASKARARIVKSCTVADVNALDTCTGPACVPFCATCDPNCVADCVLATHGKQVDDPSVEFADLIDFEYATPPACGDGVINHLDEECEGADDAACPGQCGARTSSFPCLCLTKPRQRVIEHATGDLDNGWRGDSHDGDVVEGGGYVVDLYDCDGPAGPDTVCTVGPSCSVVPNPPCANDAQCSLAGLGACRKERTAVGPHCHLDVQQTCAANGDCPGVGNFCVEQFHGPPLPLAAGGVSVCAVNVFTDDVVGTTDLATGSTATRIRQDSIVFLGPTQSQPCPVCGGFCSAAPNDYGGRHNCATNADCLDVPGSTCVTTPVCSFGPNADQPCRPNPPFGGSTSFGTSSVDCLPFPPDISSGGLDILSNPSTTGTVTLAPSVQCDDPAFSGKTCAGGGSNGADCTDDSECPGGTCSFQCFCPNGGAVQQRPNGCDAACVGGPSDASPCADDSDCPGGFCHAADCRPDLTAPPQLQPYEGSCTTTVEGHCSQSVSRTCAADPDCNPPDCPTCTPGETCLTVAKNCFLNSGITRVGVPSTSDPVYVSVFCVGAVANSSVNAAAGLPGPGTIRQPTTTSNTGF